MNIEEFSKQTSRALQLIIKCMVENDISISIGITAMSSIIASFIARSKDSEIDEKAIFSQMKDMINKIKENKD